MGIADLDTGRLRKTLALALSSNFDGEILSSIAAFRRTLDAAGMKSIDVVEVFGDFMVSLAVLADSTQANIALLNVCLKNWDDLTTKERGFIFTIKTRSDSLSDKQRQWLCDIAARFTRRRAGGQDAGASRNNAQPGV